MKLVRSLLYKCPTRNVREAAGNLALLVAGQSGSGAARRGGARRPAVWRRGVGRRGAARREAQGKMQTGFPMVLFRWSFLMLFQFFFRRETKKFMEIKQFRLSSSAVMPTWPTATPMQSTFFSWNFTWLRIIIAFISKSSPRWQSAGNFPALLRPGPNSLGIVGIKTCEAIKAS